MRINNFSARSHQLIKTKFYSLNEKEMCRSQEKGALHDVTVIGISTT